MSEWGDPDFDVLEVFEHAAKVARQNPREPSPIAPRCDSPGCNHLAHFAVRLDDGELADVCMVHYLAVTDGIRESDD